MTSLGRCFVPPGLVQSGLLLGVLVVVGCDGPVPGHDAGPDAGPMQDARIVYDGTVYCDSDDDCDDGVSCTNDSCGADGICRNGVNQLACDDGVFCNGVERCDPRRGCMPPSMRETCNDDDVCTIDRCDEEADTCRHSPRDLDMDGDADWFCAGGGDCNDTDATVSSTVNEVCDDWVDNDCDGEVDEAECGAPPHDTCADALDVSAGGFFMLDTTGATSDYAIDCGFTGAKDLVATFTLTEPRSVTIEGEGDFFTVALSLRGTCTDASSELACESGFPGRIRTRSLDAGTYFVIVSASSPGPIGLTVTYAAPIPPATNDTCASPIDVSAGGSFMGSMVDVGDELTTSCGFGGAPDLVYTFTTATEQDVQISARSITGESLSWSVRTACSDASSELRCTYGSPAAGRIHQLAAGTYFLVVEGPSWADVDFTLMVDFLAPTPPAPGDTCADPLPLTLGTLTTGTLLDKEDDIDVSCGFYYRDAVHTFTLDSDSDVTVQLGTGSYGNFALRSVCDDDATELRCTSGNPARSRVRNVPAGTYYVIAEASGAGTYTLQVDASPPSVPVEVSGNDTCASATDVPVTGGLFHGSTTALTNDYGTTMCGGGATSKDAAFRLVLGASQHVVISTEGSVFDTVLHVHRDACGSAENYCDDDGGDGSSSLIDRVLDAGTWFIVVDGYGSSSGGEYLLEVTVSDP